MLAKIKHEIGLVLCSVLKVSEVSLTIGGLQFLVG